LNSIHLKYHENLYEIASVSDLLSQIDDRNHSILLDSGKYKHNNDDNSSENAKTKTIQNFSNADYDIFCSHPCLTFEKHDNHSHLQIDILSSSLDNINFNKLEQDPLKQMRDILEQVKHNSQDHSYNSSDDGGEVELPFNGGWLGYFSYDFGRSLELPERKRTTDKNVHFCRFGLYRWALISDHKKKTSVLYNFGLSKKEWQKIKNIFNLQIPNKLNTAKRFELNSPFKSNINFETYREFFRKIQENIIAGNCYQINYAHQFSASFQGSSFDAYQHLTKVNKSPFSAYLNFADFQILSLSPERFIQIKNRSVLTQPIKGTAPRHSEEKIDKKSANDLLSSEKDRAENLMIVDLLRNDLSKTADTGSVKVPELFGLYSFESVHHLISTITSKLAPEFDMFDILQSCLPGGSITGAPKIAAMKIIDELESFNRGIYCGVIGYMDFKGNMDTNICIRTLLAKNNKMTCYAGGGIVFDSNVESEYQETFDKISKIIPVLEGEFFDPSMDKTT